MSIAPGENPGRGILHVTSHIAYKAGELEGLMVREASLLPKLADEFPEVVICVENARPYLFHSPWKRRFPYAGRRGGIPFAEILAATMDGYKGLFIMELRPRYFRHTGESRRNLKRVLGAFSPERPGRKAKVKSGL